ncbi:hypothetical protein GGS20DRAFT_561227 [Poronia punctata]|nr:hypothetical protein GGS20DRAFT_561227 [Poronia punctata]
MSLRTIVSYNDESQDHNEDIITASNSTAPVSQNTLNPNGSTRPTPQLQRRYVVIPDPVAFRFLENEKAVTVIQREAKLVGYELYLVEQWACSRKSPTLVIVTYTGDTNQSVAVGVLSVPADEEAWPKGLRAYFNIIHQYHARPRDTSLGQLMVTNLSSFPSALTVISVPDGDIKNQRRTFIINENLKRLGCSGRAAMTLCEPAVAAKAKFRQLYKTDGKIPVEEAVIEMVKLCQIALFLFGKLGDQYIDGLLCDMTETAVGDWWIESGVEYFNVEPTDGILGPTTVAALLGLLGGARNRLSHIGAPVPKDVFDAHLTERGISYFQKYNKLERTRRLDRQTMHRLHAVTAKAAAGEAWGVQKAVKSTVTEIGGKRGEMVLGMVGSRDKGGIGDIETTDLDRFISLVTGERAKWLWHGKPKRASALNHDKSGPDMISPGKDDARTSFEDDASRRRKEESPAVYSTPAPGSAVSINDSPGDRDAARRGVFKNVARDARSGLGRIKDVMTSGGGLRAHTSRPSRDEVSESALLGTQYSTPSGIPLGLVSSPLHLPAPGQLGRAFSWRHKPEEYLNVIKNEGDVSTAAPPFTSTNLYESSTGDSRAPPPNGDSARTLASNETRRTPSIARTDTDVNARSSLPIIETALTGSAGEAAVAYSDQDAEYRAMGGHSSLQRRHSVRGPPNAPGERLRELRWARRLSFSDAEEAVLKWEEIAVFGDTNIDNTTADKQLRLLGMAQAIYSDVSDIEKNVGPWVMSKIQSVDAVCDIYSGHLDQLHYMFYDASDVFQEVHHNYQATMKEYKESLTEALSKIEGEAAKLEYEITALVSRVTDAEEGATQFEIQVQEVEQRAEELKVQLEKESWVHWAVRTLTGIGTGPNITRPRP